MIYLVLQFIFSFINILKILSLAEKPRKFTYLAPGVLTMSDIFGKKIVLTIIFCLKE